MVKSSLRSKKRRPASYWSVGCDDLLEDILQKTMEGKKIIPLNGGPFPDRNGPIFATVRFLESILFEHYLCVVESP
jgi:hypothetical protein